MSSMQIDAREISVKYLNDKVNVINFIEYELKKSSFVKEMFYKPSQKYLIVRLNNTFYHCCEIPQRKVTDWVSSISLGSFYIKHIRNNYSCKN